MQATRVALNTAIRAKPANVDLVVDLASAVESSLNSGLWAAPPQITPDGIHENPAGYLQIVASGVINPALFTR